LSQEQLGNLLGVNQKRIARIERAPEVTSFDQITRLVAALGGRIVLESDPIEAATEAKNPAADGDTW
jgi:HTH-type transcriptional regulator/antitoxin HipB